MDLAVGQVYGEKYRIVRLLGQGAMGAVYEGENVRIHRKVAIKTLHAGMADKGDTLQRFEREAQAAGRIGSKHICEVLDMGDLPDGSRFMVMEHLDGVTLQQHIRSSGRLKPAEASPIVQQLLDGLGAAHQAGIIHRDLKPANVFLVRQPGRADFVKILDFGVSKFSVLGDEMSMTRTGAVLGTPYYMSPEQAKGARHTDARSDLYAVGVILYECITGQVPFSAETFNELLFRIVLEQPPPPESFAPDLPPEFAAIIRKAMAREPADRYQDAAEFKQVLADWSAKAAALEEPTFDGNATLDKQTVMRSASPLLAPALRPPQPSLTAQGTMIVESKPPPQGPALSSQGTVIIDPAVAGQPPPNGAPAQASRGAGPTQPLPVWTGPGPVATPAQVAPPYPAPAYAAQPMPQGVAQVTPGPYAYVPAEPPASQRRAGRSPVQVVAFLGAAVVLLGAVALWAVLRRGGGDASSDAPQGSSSVAAAGTDAPSALPTGAPATAQPSASAAPSDAPSAPASAASAATSASAAPSSAATDEPGVAAASGSSGGARSSGSRTWPGAGTGGKPAGTSTGKPGGKNPPGGRTVSKDL
jgi:serine/threonine-protein kinase